MSEDDERGGTPFSMGRTLSLSDGIFAIAMTLLAFQVQPPDLSGDQQRHLAQALADLSSRYWIYALSFAVIGIFWMGHHRLFGYFEAIDDTTTLLNLVVLMAMAALPFPSAVMGRYGQQRVAVILYAASMAVAGTLMLCLWVVADRRHLLSDRTTKAEINAGLWRAGSTAVVFCCLDPRRRGGAPGGAVHLDHRASIAGGAWFPTPAGHSSGGVRSVATLSPSVDEVGGCCE